MKEKKSLITFLLITLVLSGIVDYFWIRGGVKATAAGISALLMWCPGVAALITRAIFYRKQPVLVGGGRKSVFLLAAVVIPFLYIALSYGVYWLITPGSYTGNFNLRAMVPPAYADKVNTIPGVAITLVILFLSSTISAAGEEIGWRGFMLPQMAKIWNFKTAVLVSGLIWAVWHMPIIIAGIYLPGTPLWYQLPVFVVSVLSFTVIISVITLRSGSVWPAILIHAAHNCLDQKIFGTLTSGPNQPYLVSETGLITIAFMILAAILTVRLFWKPTPQLAQPPQPVVERP